MTGILFFMIISLFLYTLFLKHYNINHCPRCHSHKITIEKFIDYILFTCQTCKFCYKDYYSFLELTPISEQFEIDFDLCDDDESEDDIDD